MKKSIFTQEWEVKGQTSTVKGKIIVTMNYDTMTTMYYNESTRKDDLKIIPIHKIEGYINDKLWWDTLNNITEEEFVLGESKSCRKRMDDYMVILSNAEPEKSFTDKMIDLGFRQQ